MGAAAVALAKEKIAGLKALIETSKLEADNCKQAADSAFQGIFAHRYRDVAPAVRVDILDVLQQMLVRFPADYVNNTCVARLRARARARVRRGST